MNVVQSLLIGVFSSDINIILVYGMYDVKFWRANEASKTHSGVKINEIVMSVGLLRASERRERASVASEANTLL